MLLLAVAKRQGAGPVVGWLRKCTSRLMFWAAAARKNCSRTNFNLRKRRRRRPKGSSHGRVHGVVDEREGSKSRGELRRVESQQTRVVGLILALTNPEKSVGALSSLNCRNIAISLIGPERPEGQEYTRPSVLVAVRR
jgi:hypothetical protein